MWVSLRVKTMNMNHHVEVVENQVLQLTAYDMPEIGADEVLVEVYYSAFVAQMYLECSIKAHTSTLSR